MLLNKKFLIIFVVMLNFGTLNVGAQELTCENQLNEKNDLINVLIAEKTSLLRELPLVRHDRSMLRQTIEDLNIRLQTIDTKNQESIERVKNPLKIKISHLNQQLRQCTTLANSNRNLLEKVPVLSLQVKEYQEALDAQKKEIIIYKDHISDLNIRKESCDVQSEKLTKLLNEKIAQIERAQLSISDLTEGNKKLFKNKKEIDAGHMTLQQQMTSANTQLEKALALSESRNAKIKKYASLIVETQKERDMLIKTNGDLEKRIEKLNLDFAKLQVWADGKDKAFNELKEKFLNKDAQAQRSKSKHYWEQKAQQNKETLENIKERIEKTRDMINSP